MNLSPLGRQAPKVSTQIVPTVYDSCSLKYFASFIFSAFSATLAAWIEEIGR